MKSKKKRNKVQYIVNSAVTSAIPTVFVTPKPVTVPVSKKAK